MTLMSAPAAPAFSSESPSEGRGLPGCGGGRRARRLRGRGLALNPRDNQRDLALVNEGRQAERDREHYARGQKQLYDPCVSLGVRVQADGKPGS